MQASEVKIGGRYRAKVSGRLVTVHVLSIRETAYGRRVYEVLNTATERYLTFRSAARLRPMPTKGE